ncbi:ribosome maturation factor RimP [Catenovulum maritimum]|jgi:ribosome maturation factor RimP|nr:ribosome maturation factor RimP [Catenovulum maritimum]
MQLESYVAQAVAVTDFTLWGVEFIRAGKHSTLRVFIEGENGISVDDCAEVSRQVSAILDVEDPIKDEYTLEVSSPGMDRILFKPEQYPAYVGQHVNVKTRLPIEGRRKFKGLLQSIEEKSVVLEIDNDEYVIPFNNIEKAQVVPQF